MTEQEKFEYIEQYLKGRLSPTEQEEFEQLMLTDQNFADEVKQHQQLHEVLFDSGLLDVKKRMQNIQHKGGGNGIGRKGSLAKKGLIGFSSLIILGAITWFGANFFGKESPKQANNPQNQVGETTAPVDPGNHSSTKPNQPKSSNPALPENQTNKNHNAENKPLELEKIQISSNNDLQLQNIGKSEISLTTPAPTLPKQAIENPNIPNKVSFDPCREVNIALRHETVPSCKSEARGQLLIDSNSIYGGTPPYAFVIEETDQVIQGYRVDGLESGAYTLMVLDDQGCSEKLTNIYIQEKDCQAEQEFVFVPDEQSKWEYPFGGNANGELIIRNRKGQQIVKKQIRNGIPEGWRGKTNTGKPAPMGAYQVIFKPFNGEPRTWSLTVIR